MITPPSGTRIWLAGGVTDMRKGFDGLAMLVQEKLQRDPFRLGGIVFGDTKTFAHFADTDSCPRLSIARLASMRLSETASSRSGQWPASLRRTSTAVGAGSPGYRPVFTRGTRTSVWRPPTQ